MLTYCDCYNSGGSGFPCFPLPMVPLSLWYSSRSRALAEHCINPQRLLPPGGWGGGFRCETCFATCPRKNKDNHAKHDIVLATYAMFEMGSCPACENLRESMETWHQKNPIAAIIGGLTRRCRSHPPKTNTVTRTVAPTSLIPVTVVADSLGRGGGGRGGGQRERGRE